VRLQLPPGRGCHHLLDSYRREPIADGRIHHNYVGVREGPNREYWSQIETRALRLRNTVDRKGPHKDLVIRDNTFVAVTGDGLAQKAFAVLISYQNADGSMNDANIRLEHKTTDTFGTTGEKPSHPELLDWLAVTFMDDGWSVKQLIRRMVLSHTYRQAVTGDARARAVDPENRLLARANRRRLEAECIRDAMLVVSGRLRLDRGGPTFPAGLSADYGFRHNDTRRSVYSPVFRNSLPELFEFFDFADPSVSTGRRNVSTVVPQALFLMNHPFVLEQSRHAARRLLGERRDILWAYRLALGRPPMEAERRLAETFLAAAGSKADEREDAWAQLFQVLFASLDFRYLN
jgi:hypothetical protein